MLKQNWWRHGEMPQFIVNSKWLINEQRVKFLVQSQFCAPDMRTAFKLGPHYKVRRRRNGRPSYACYFQNKFSVVSTCDLHPKNHGEVNLICRSSESLLKKVLSCIATSSTGVAYIRNFCSFSSEQHWDCLKDQHYIANCTISHIASLVNAVVMWESKLDDFRQTGLKRPWLHSLTKYKWDFVAH